jgi:hypothetical protein
MELSVPDIEFEGIDMESADVGIEFDRIDIEFAGFAIEFFWGVTSQMKVTDGTPSTLANSNHRISKDQNGETLGGYPTMDFFHDRRDAYPTQRLRRLR